jgi:hypothetical protein
MTHMGSSENGPERRKPRSSEELVRDARERYSGGAKSEDPGSADLPRDPYREREIAAEDAAPLRFSEELKPEVLDRESQLDEPIFTESTPESLGERVESRHVEVTHGFPPFEPSGIPDRPRRKSFAFPVRLVVVGALVLGGLAYSYFTEAKRDESGSVVEAGDVGADALQVGDCLMLPQGASLDVEFEFESLRAVPCSEPHDTELYESVSHPGGAYPGESVLIDFAEEACISAYEEFTGAEFSDEILFDFLYTWPKRDSWSSGHRAIQCHLTSIDAQQLTGTQRGKGLVGWSSLQLSSCYRVVETDSYSGYSPVDCAQSHDFEYYAATELFHEEGEPFPEQEFLASFGEGFCADSYSPYVGRSWEFGVTPDFSWIHPTPETWSTGDRLLQCFLIDPGGGSLKESYAVDG